MGKQVFIGGSILAALAVVLLAICAGQLWEIVPANEVVVIQHLSGELRAVVEPGPTWQGFGSVTHYHKRAQYAFNKGCRKEDPAAHIPKIVRFYDGGHADICGAISWEMPLDPKRILALHQIYSSQEAIETQLIDKAIDNAAYTSGPTMSSTESSGERRTELLQIIDDQTRLGVFETTVVQKNIKDPVTGKDAILNVVTVVKDEKGMPKRRIGSMAAEVGIRFEPLTISEIRYSKEVEAQIAERQKAITSVQTSVANATKAEQDARTTEQQGRAEAAKAKWEQEKINAKGIAEAEATLRVAQLTAQTAEQRKRASILEGEGEATRKRLVMEANGALDTRLDAWVKVNGMYADAIKEYQGAWVPQISMGGSGTGGTNAAQSMMDMFMVKTAKELGMSMDTVGVGGKAAAQPAKSK
jgi:regulator of protease activity HflC (stomatin/prohibitin superfamily)